MNEYLSLPILTEISTSVLQLAGSGAVVCAVVLGAARLLGRHSGPLAYGILMGGIVALLAIPALIGLGHSLPATWFFSPVEPDTEVMKIPSERLPELLSRPAPDEPATEPTLPIGVLLGALLGAAWAVGTMLVLVRLMLVLVKQRRLIIGQLWHPVFWNDDLKTRLASKLGIKKFPDVYLSPVTPMPMVLGICRPQIILPEQAPPSWEQPQWEAILLHEAAHIARRDHWAVPAQLLAVAMFWWCPLVYMLARRLSALRESICDDYALQGPCDALAYAELLVESAESLVNLKSVPVALALLNSARGGLEARVTRLLAKERRPMTKLSLPGKLAAGLLVIACLFATTATAISGGQPAPAKKVQIKIIVDGKEIDLGDPKLWELIEAAQKLHKVTKEAGNFFFKWNVPAGDLLHREVPGEVLKRSEVITTDQLTPLNLFSDVDGSVQLHADPRIEQLIKQAEAIKPGSGDAIRKALQATATVGLKSTITKVVAPGEWFIQKQRIDDKGATDLNVVIRKALQAPSKPGDKADQGHLLGQEVPQRITAVLKIDKNQTNSTATWKVLQSEIESPDFTRLLEKLLAKKIIILSVEDGKVVQVPEADWRKILIKSIGDDKNVRSATIQLHKAASAAIKGKADAVKTPPATSHEVEELRHRLEVISAQLRELTKRLESQKKQY